MYIYGYLINCKYFNRTCITAGICTFPYPIEKVGDSPYPCPYLINAGISHQNEDKFGQ